MLFLINSLVLIASAHVDHDHHVEHSPVSDSGATSVACYDTNPLYCQKYGQKMCQSGEYQKLCPLTCGACGATSEGRFLKFQFV